MHALHARPGGRAHRERRGHDELPVRRDGGSCSCRAAALRGIPPHHRVVRERVRLQRGPVAGARRVHQGSGHILTLPISTHSIVAAAAALQDTAGTVRVMGSEFIGAVANLAVKSSPLRVPYTCMALMKAQLISPVSIDGRCNLLTAKHVRPLLGKESMVTVRQAEGLMKHSRALLDAFGDQARPRTPALMRVHASRHKL